MKTFAEMKIFVNFANFDMQKYQGILPSNGRKDAYYSSLDSSCQNVSSGSQFMSLASLKKSYSRLIILRFLRINSYLLMLEI